VEPITTLHRHLHLVFVLLHGRLRPHHVQVEDRDCQEVQLHLLLPQNAAMVLQVDHQDLVQVEVVVPW
jgi:hypothetical protein